MAMGVTQRWNGGSGFSRIMTRPNAFFSNLYVFGGGGGGDGERRKSHGRSLCHDAGMTEAKRGISFFSCFLFVLSLFFDALARADCLLVIWIDSVLFFETLEATDLVELLSIETCLC